MMGLLVGIRNSLFGPREEPQTTNGDNLARIAREVVPLEEYPDYYNFPILTDKRENAAAWIKEMELMKRINEMCKAEINKIIENVSKPCDSMIDNYLDNSNGFPRKVVLKWEEKIAELRKAHSILKDRAFEWKKVKISIIRGNVPSESSLKKLEEIETACQNGDGLNAVKEVRQWVSLQRRRSLNMWEPGRPANKGGVGNVETGRIGRAMSKVRGGRG